MTLKRLRVSDVSDFAKYLDTGRVSFFGYRGVVLPDIVSKKKSGTVKVFRKGEVQRGGAGFSVTTYENTLEIRDERSDVYFLDNEALKVFFVDFPGSARYVLARCTLRSSWLIALPGLLRRALIGLVTIQGFLSLEVSGRKEVWLLIRHELRESLNTRLSLSSNIGVSTFLSHLKKEAIKYVVLRFYRQLPNLNRVGGDIDILVSDEDELRLRDFLQQNPGGIGIDVWTPSRTSHNSITYYPPPLAREILKSATDGPAGSRIPGKREAFLSLAYHALYHKGFFSGIPSKLFPADVNKEPQNDYAGELEVLARDLGISLTIDMESINEYLHAQGWQPKLDTLAKIAPRNKWVWKQFFSNKDHIAGEIGLGVLILKNKAVELSLDTKVISFLQTHGEFKIIDTKNFKEDEVMLVASHLRGGVWNEKSGVITDYLPAFAIVIIDTRAARAAKMSLVHTDPDKGIRQLKRTLRHMFDTGGISLIHSTDNTHEAWEYIHWCYLNDSEMIRVRVEKEFEDISINLLQRARLFLAFAPRYVLYRAALLKQSLRKGVVEWLMRI